MRLALWPLLSVACADSTALLAKSSVTACASLVANVSWEFDTSEEFYGAMCEYEPAIGSWTTCINDFLEEQHLESSIEMKRMCIENMNHRCKALDTFRTPFTDYQFLESLTNATQYLESGSVSDRSGRAPVKFDKEGRISLGRAWVVNLRNLNASNATSMYLYAFLVIVSVLAAASHHLSTIVFQQKTINKLRGWLTLPTLNNKHAQPIAVGPGGLLPTRLELGVIVGFLVVHAGALCYKYELDKDETIEGISMQMLKYVGYRTGLLAFAQCPLIVFFSGRNSMFELFTGLHYSTSIVLHKWISRLMTFDALVHGVIFVFRAYLGGYLGHAKKSRFWLCGALTLYSSLFLCLLAFGKLRHRRYETFLITHIVLAMAFFYYAWQHVKSLGWCTWIYVSVALWFLEKTLRVTRILAFGGRIRAHADLHELDIVRLTIPKPRKGWNAHPGEYVFVYFLFAKTWWQSHPFTFVDRGDSIIVVIKAKEGATGTLLSKVKQSGGSAEVSVLVEGPYGESASVAEYDQKLFVCGGSGIPGPLSYVLNTPKPHMLLVIVARDLDILRAFKKEILMLPESNVYMYITKPSSAHGSINDADWDGHKNVIRGRRPDISALVHEFFHTSDSLAITCCGPPALVDMTRDITATALRRNPTKRVAYFEEYQTW